VEGINSKIDDLYSEECIQINKRPYENFFKKLKFWYKDKTVKISENLYNFIEKNKRMLKTIENILEPSFLLYGYAAFLDYISSWSVCESPQDEVNPLYAKLFENYGIDKGHLLAALWEIAVFGTMYETSKYVDKIAKKIDPQLDTLPFLRKMIPYVYAISCGVKHYMAYLNNW
jgi:hypothetical protein